MYAGSNVTSNLVMPTRCLKRLSESRSPALIQGHAVTDDTVTQLADQLNEVLPLPYFFDVLNENTLNNDALRQHIKRVGIILFDTSHKAPSTDQPRMNTDNHG